MVIGGNPTKPDTVDLRWVSALLYKNETIEETGVAAGVLNHPATGVAWLANKFHQHGSRLEAGELILAGSFTRPMWVEQGDSVLCDYGPLGRCHVGSSRTPAHLRPGPCQIHSLPGGHVDQLGKHH
ncbi:FAA hydrolase family protein [Flaviflexus ciconiae]|uniref:hypothetical protein n=1 Tax=Flaviflexus ciconiae TaxID=2496867 RepID=UPI001D18CA2E|nr:hypothetical protein [Flaviflexus ciconiae]